MIVCYSLSWLPQLIFLWLMGAVLIYLTLGKYFDYRTHKFLKDFKVGDRRA